MNIREELHNHPGVSGEECFAHDLIVRELQSLAPTRLHTHVGGYGVVAFWGVAPLLPTVAFRADTDALPIGHRCGHDGHTAILLRFAHTLSQRNNTLLVFQPEEETGRGAEKIIASGVLRQYNVKAFFGLHNLPGYPLGTVVLNTRTFAAASTGVRYCFEGRKTHASTPEMGINPGMAVAEMIERFEALNSGDTAIDRFCQSTLICVRVGEEAFGTSAGEAEVMFTLRAFTNKAMEHLLATADTIAGEVADKHRLRLSSSQCDPFPATENDGEVVRRLGNVLSQQGVAIVHNDAPFRWSEDFAHYLRLYSGAFFGIGAGVGHSELHHPDYVFPDALIDPAARVFAIINEAFQQ